MKLIKDDGFRKMYDININDAFGRKCYVVVDGDKEGNKFVYLRG